MNEILFLAWRNLYRNPRRAFASLATVAFGAAGLLIYQGFNEGIMNQYRENTIRVRYGHGQLYPRGYRDRAFEHPWELWIANAESLESPLKRIPSVVEIYPRVSFHAFLEHGGVTLGAKGEGVVSARESKFFTAMNFVQGADIIRSHDIILGKGLATGLGVSIGDSINGMCRTSDGGLARGRFCVAGIFHTGSKEFDDAFFRIELRTAQQLLHTDRVEHVAIRTTEVDAWSEVAKEAERLFPGLEAIPFDELDAVYYKNAIAFLRSQFEFIRFVILLVVTLGILNTIAVGLLERGPEVGALRANGETRARLFQILVLENGLLGIFGGVAGIGIAFLLDATAFSGGIPMPPGPGITRQFLVYLEIQPEHTSQALLLPALATVLGSMWPITSLLRKKIPGLLKAQ